MKRKEPEEWKVARPGPWSDCAFRHHNSVSFFLSHTLFCVSYYTFFYPIHTGLVWWTSYFFLCGSDVAAEFYLRQLTDNLTRFILTISWCYSIFFRPALVKRDGTPSCVQFIRPSRFSFILLSQLFARWKRGMYLWTRLFFVEKTVVGCWKLNSLKYKEKKVLSHLNLTACCVIYR